MPKIRLYSQERMPIDVVPLPDKQGYDTIKEMFEDPKHPYDKKMHFIATVCQFETLNGFRKADLHAMLVWLYNQHF